MNIKNLYKLKFNFELDSVLILLLIFSCLIYFDKKVLTSLFVAYIYASLWPFLKKIILGKPVKVYKMFITLGVVPLTLLALIYIQGLAG